MIEYGTTAGNEQQAIEHASFARGALARLLPLGGLLAIRDTLDSILRFGDDRGPDQRGAMPGGSMALLFGDSQSDAVQPGDARFER